MRLHCDGQLDPQKPRKNEATVVATPTPHDEKPPAPDVSADNGSAWRRAVAKNQEGARHLESENYEDAAAAFTEAIALYRRFATAYRNRAKAYRALGRSSDTDSDLNRASFLESRHDSTFAEQIAGLFRVLENLGVGPEWHPLAEPRTWHPQHVSGNAELIRCTSGPIEAVELRSRKIDEGGDETTEWVYYTDVCFLLRSEWPKRWLLDLHMFSVWLDHRGRFTGDDCGLGIIDDLNTLSSSVGALRTAEIKLGGHAHRSDKLPPHLEVKGKMEIVLSSWSSKNYESRDEAPLLRWNFPSSRSMKAIATVAEVVAADPPYLPPQTRTPETTAVPAPWISYLWWATYPILAVPILAIAFGFLASAAGWLFRDSQGGIGWYIVLGLIFLIVGIFIGLAGLNRLQEIKRGFTRLVGTLDRKWAKVVFDENVTESSPDSQEPNYFYIRVEGLPFLVPRSQYRALSEGQTVEVIYWPKDKRVASLHAETTKHG